MPKYSYVALDKLGNETKGNIEAGSQNEAIGRVKDMQLFPTRITESEREDKGGKKAAKTKAAPPKGKGGGKGGGMKINSLYKVRKYLSCGGPAINIQYQGPFGDRSELCLQSEEAIKLANWILKTFPKRSAAAGKKES